MFKKFMYFLMIGVFGFIVSGCATIVHGTTTRVMLDSEPQGATAVVGNQTVTTPGSVVLRNSDAGQVVFKKEGYKETGYYFSKVMSGWVWGNVALGGIIGLAVDMMSGGAYKVEPKEVHVTLEPQG